ncbi:hypothetical protein BDZ94DRAFT_901031 [Collybia nuda]|uniref:PH domain-containing protein n=1 Tax=Collybia nuda TaxID=64659 RepID=A0A9P5YFQ3_9AGAR|nr:hypothetical protein BDZ94DRAFT_901031 [Collybia nuda]
MAERPRSQSVAQTRPPVGSQSRASRLLQKVSNFKDRIRLTSRKTKDDRDGSNPYPSQTHLFGGVKPYMSHPLLGLSGMTVEPFNPADQDGDDSSASHSPARSDFRRPSPIPLSGLPQTNPPATISEGFVHESQIGVAITTRENSIDGLPQTLNTIPRPSTSDQPSNATIPSHTTITAQTTAGVISSNSNENISPIDMPRSSSDPKEKVKPGTNSPSASLGRTLIRKLSRPRLKTKSSSNHLTPSPASSSPTPSTPGVIPRPAVITYSTSLPAVQNAPITPPPDLTRRGTAPRLVLPPANHRFSLTLTDGSSARLSPSVIFRPPPLPIMRLPPLPTINIQPADLPAGGNSRGRVGLRNMPELPRQGNDPEEDGDEDDIQEDGDEDEDLEDGDEGSGARNMGSSLSNYDDESFGRPSTSMSGSIDGGGLLPPSLSSRTKSHSRSSSYTENVLLSDIDISRIDLSFLDHPPPDIKGKGKARSDGEEEDDHGADTSRTPTSGSPHRDYFNHRTRSIDRHTRAHARKDSVSPARTPRASDSLRTMLPAPSHSPSPLDAPPRPGMYKRASRSMIDIHAIAKKEELEKMIRDDEEAVKVERRRSLVVRDGQRASLIIDKMELSTVPDEEEAVEGVSPENKLQNRFSKAPAYDSIPHPLRRRRSMPMYTEATTPPPYPSFAPFAHPMSASVKIQPRDDEGREHLPSYSNDIYVKTIIPRKMEFTAPGVQAKDRKWRRVMCVLEGTVLKIYRCPAGTTGVSAIGEWWEKKVGVGDVSQPAAGTSTIATSNSGASLVAEGVPKAGEQGRDVTELRVDPPTPVPTGSTFSTQQPSATRSRLNIAVQLLKPSRPHGRSQSDAPIPPPKSQSPRPSLSVPGPPHGSVSSSSSSRPSTATGRYPSTTPSSTSGNSMALSVPSSASSQQFSSESSPSSSPSRSQFRPGKGDLPDPDPTDLIKAYTMQNAESGLGNDYIKRKNVIRVRVEGEQFLLQAKDVAGVVEWIEALQASANIALDLDERLMPKGPLFPRRRRRRGVRRPVTDTTGPTRLSIDHVATVTNTPANTLASYE